MSRRRQVLQLGGKNKSKLHRYGYSKELHTGKGGLPSLVGDYPDSESEEEDAAQSETQADAERAASPAPASAGGDGVESNQETKDEAPGDMDDELRHFLSEIESIPMPEDASLETVPAATSVSSEKTWELNAFQELKDKNCEEVEEPSREEEKDAVKKPVASRAYSMFVKGEPEFVNNTPSAEAGPGDSGKSEDSSTAKQTEDQEEEMPEEPVTTWQMVQDETTQYYYYWNTVSNQVTWEIPMEYTQFLLLHREYQERIAKYTPDQLHKLKDKKLRKSDKTKENGPKMEGMPHTALPKAGDGREAACVDEGSRLASVLSSDSISFHKKHRKHEKKKKSKKHKSKRDDYSSEEEGKAKCVKTLPMIGPALEERPEEDSVVEPKLASIVPYLSDPEDDEGDSPKKSDSMPVLGPEPDRLTPRGSPKSERMDDLPMPVLGAEVDNSHNSVEDGDCDLTEKITTQGKEQTPLERQEPPSQGKEQTPLERQEPPSQGKEQTSLERQELPSQGKEQTSLERQEPPSQGKEQTPYERQELPPELDAEDIIKRILKEIPEEENTITKSPPTIPAETAQDGRHDSGDKLATCSVSPSLEREDSLVTTEELIPQVTDSEQTTVAKEMDKDEPEMVLSKDSSQENSDLSQMDILKVIETKKSQVSSQKEKEVLDMFAEFFPSEMQEKVADGSDVSNVVKRLEPAETEPMEEGEIAEGSDVSAAQESTQHGASVAEPMRHPLKPDKLSSKPDKPSSKRDKPSSIPDKPSSKKPKNKETVGKVTSSKCDSEIKKSQSKSFSLIASYGTDEEEGELKESDTESARKKESDTESARKKKKEKERELKRKRLKDEGGRDKESASKRDEAGSKDKEMVKKKEESRVRNKETTNKRDDSKGKDKDKDSAYKRDDSKGKGKDKDSANKRDDSKGKDKDSANKRDESKGKDKDSANKRQEVKMRDKSSASKRDTVKVRDKHTANKKHEVNSREMDIVNKKDAVKTKDIIPKKGDVKMREKDIVTKKDDVKFGELDIIAKKDDVKTREKEIVPKEEVIRNEELANNREEVKITAKELVHIKEEGKMRADIKDEAMVTETEDADPDDFDLDDIDRALELALEKKLEQKKVELGDEDSLPKAETGLTNGTEADQPEVKDVKVESETQNESVSTEEALKNLVKDIADVALSKLEFLDIGTDNLSRLQVLFIELQTRLSDWTAGGLSTEYFQQQLQVAEGLLEQYEMSAVPEGWGCQWDRLNNRYYYRHKETGHKQWEYPEGKEEREEEPPPPKRKESRKTSSHEDRSREEVDDRKSRSSKHKKREKEERSKYDKYDKRSSSRRHHRSKRKRRRDPSSSSEDSVEGGQQLSSRYQHKNKRKKRSRSKARSKSRSPSVEILEGLQDEIEIREISSSPEANSKAASPPAPESEAPDSRPTSPLPSLSPATTGEVSRGTPEGEVPSEPNLQMQTSEPVEEAPAADEDMKEDIDGVEMETQPEVEEEKEEEVNPAVISRPPQLSIPPHVVALQPAELYAAPPVPAAMAPPVPTAMAPPVAPPEAEASQDTEADKTVKKKKKDKKSLSTSSSMMLKKKQMNTMVQKWQRVKKQVEREEKDKEIRQAAIRQKIAELK